MKSREYPACVLLPCYLLRMDAEYRMQDRNGPDSDYLAPLRHFRISES